MSIMAIMHDIAFSGQLARRAHAPDHGTGMVRARHGSGRSRPGKRDLLFAALAIAVSVSLSLTGPVEAHQPHDPVMAIAVSPAYAVDQTIFLATGLTTVTLGVHTVLKSSDGGTTWEVVSDLPSYPVRALAISPDYARDGTVFAATLGGGLYRTTDLGESWIPVGAEIGQLVTDVALSPSYGGDGTLFAVNADNHVFKSTDRGQSWTQLQSPQALNADVSVIALSPNYEADHTLLLGTTGDGVFKTTDDGQSWISLSQGLPNSDITTLAFSPSYASDHTILAATFGDGVFVSRDSGTTWNASNEGISDLEITTIAMSPYYEEDSTIFVASAAEGVFKSTDGGRSWFKTGEVKRTLSAQTQAHFQALAITIDHTNDLLIFLGMFEGLWKSADGGLTWQYVELLPTYLVRSLALSPNYEEDQTLFAATYGGGILWSDDGGHTWAFRNTGLLNSYPDPTEFSPGYATDGTVFCGTVWALQKSVDGGAHWQTMTMLGVPTFPRTFALSPAFSSDQMVFIGTDNNETPNPRYVLYGEDYISTNGFFISADGGDTWVPTELNGVPIHSVAVSPGFASDQTVFASSLWTGLYKSTDGGTTWAALQVTTEEPGVFAVALSPTYDEDQTLFASTVHSGAFKSMDGGTSWARIPGSEQVTVLDIALSPNYAVDRTLFVSTMQSGLLKSEDGGNSLMSTALPGNYVTSVAVSPAYAMDESVFAATYQGIYKSEDGGLSWTRVSTLARYEQDRWTSLDYTGDWHLLKTPLASSSYVAWSNSPGSVAFHFVGSGVRWIGGKGPRHGIAEIHLDGAAQGVIDLYAPEALLQQVLWRKDWLPYRQHELTVTVAGSSNSLSEDNIVTIDAFDVSLARDEYTLYLPFLSKDTLKALGHGAQPETFAHQRDLADGRRSPEQGGKGARPETFVHQRGLATEGIGDKEYQR